MARISLKGSSKNIGKEYSLPMIIKLEHSDWNRYSALVENTPKHAGDELHHKDSKNNQ